jgi:predicted O-methyltransferase YrrM
MATEIECLDMLEALVWMLKPEVIVETGCYKGYGTDRLINGVIKNGSGHVYTCDLQSEMVEMTRKIAGRTATVEQCTGAELISKLSSIDFAFLDSGGQASVRREELELVLPKLSPWGVVAVHDTGETHPDFREEFDRAVKELNLDAVFFDTPRGFALLKKKV